MSSVMVVAAGSLDPIVLDLECDASLVERDQAAVRDGDAVGIARQIGEHRLGAGERALGIDEPAGLCERSEERGERFGAGEKRVGAEELQLAGRVCRRQRGEHQAAEQLRENAHRQAKVGLA